MLWQKSIPSWKPVLSDKHSSDFTLYQQLAKACCRYLLKSNECLSESTGIYDGINFFNDINIESLKRKLLGLP